MLEKIQRRFTKTGSLSKLNYGSRLNILGLSTLFVRRLRGDLIQLFRYYKGIDKISLVNVPATCTMVTRGHHQFKFIQEICDHYSRRIYLFNRIAYIWNKLPQEAVSVTSVNEFKNVIDQLDFCNL